MKRINKKLGTSTIIASLLAVMADAELHFFNVETFAPEKKPVSVEDALHIATTTKANGLTANSTCLKELYREKKVVRTIIMVTDEIENEAGEGNTYFAQLFYNYYVQVFPAKLVFVSFLEDPNVKGRMVKALEAFSIPVLQFRLSSIRPDLSKLDSLLALLSSHTSHFAHQVKLFESLSSHSPSSPVPHLLSLLYSHQASTSSTGMKVEGKEKEEKEKKGEEKEKKGEGKEKEEKEKKGKGISSSLLQNRQGEKKEIEDVPEAFICPLTLEVMVDPVIASDGHCYERLAIEEWFQKSKMSPITGVPLQTTLLFPNFTLKSQISTWRDSQK